MPVKDIYEFVLAVLLGANALVLLIGSLKSKWNRSAIAIYWLMLSILFALGALNRAIKPSYYRPAGHVIDTLQILCLIAYNIFSLYIVNKRRRDDETKSKITTVPVVDWRASNER